MKLRFLCGNHRAWLIDQPEQAVHWCANSFETGWHLCEQENWKDALPHMGCAFESAEILMTTRVVTASRAVDWFLRTLQGLAQTLEQLQLTQACLDVYQVAIERLRHEAAHATSPDLEARIYSHITGLHQARKLLDTGGGAITPMLPLREVKRGAAVLH